MSSKITGLTALTSIQTDDVLPVVDVHDTTQATSGTTKQITVANLHAGLATLASPTLTGTPTAPTAAALTSTTQLATTAYADSATGAEKTRALAAEALLAPLASPALTGTPTAPTKTALTNSTALATTAYADAAVSVENVRALAAEALALPLAGGTMSGAIAMGSHKITGLTNGSGAADAAAFGQLPVLAAADTSAVVGGTATAPTVRTGTLDVIAVQHPAAADWSNNSRKITSLLNGSGAQDAAAFGQIPLVDSTAANILATGAQAAGANGKWADSGHVHPAIGWIPADNGLLGACDSPGAISGVFTVAAGSRNLIKVPIRSAFTASTVWVLVSTNGAGTSTGSFCGLISSAGTLLTGSSDCVTQFTGSNAQSVTLTTPQALSAGTFVWVVLLANLSVTQPTFRTVGTPTSAIPNLNLTAANFRAAINGTGQTALATVTPSSNTSSNLIWVGIS